MNKMKKIKKINLLLIVLVLGVAEFANAQIRVGKSDPNSCAALNVQSTNKGILPPRLTTEQRNAIVNPVAGLLIFNTTKNCIEWYLGSFWYNACGDHDVSLTTNGTAVVSEYNCNPDATGVMRVGVPVSALQQNITANVLTPGTYNVSAVINGVTFNGSGSFTSTGLQKITLCAFGIPTVSGRNEFTLNTQPNCSFVRFVN